MSWVSSYAFVYKKFVVGLNFANENEAEQFGNAVEKKISEEVERDKKKKIANSKHLLGKSVVVSSSLHLRSKACS